MGGQQGFSKISTNGLVFSYDVGDQRNSYKGKPAYNVAGPIGYNVGNNNIIYDSTHYFITAIGTETVNIPALGTYNDVKYVTINNGYTSYGGGGNYNCCPSLFGYGSGMTTGVTGSTVYTYSIIYKCATGYTNSNYMYRYEYNGGTYLTEQGIFDTSKRVDLGDGWYWAYNTFTTQATCNSLVLGLWYYQYNTPDKVWVKDAMIVQGDYKIPPLNFLSGNQTRSNTQGLLDLARNTTIDLSNTSYNTNAQLYFDGTDDYINTSTILGANCTLELVIQSSNYNGKIPISLDGDNYSSGPNIFFTSNIIAWNTGDSADNPFSNSSYPNSNYHHIVVSNTSGVNAVLYIDGVRIGTANPLNATTTGANKLWIGRFHGDNNYTIAGNIPIVKVYNRALTQGEVSQNYNHYKTRFNLS